MEKPSQTETTADRVVRTGLAVACVAAVFWLNARYVLVHFTHGPALLDTGWFAWIMASGDPWLTNPHAVSDMSYFNYHLTPYLSAISVAIHALGIDRFLAFAVHQGIVFALLAASLCALVLMTWRGARSGVLLAAVMIGALLGDVALQIASFPHPEAAIVTFCLLGCVLWFNSQRGWAAAVFAATCLVREDGGLYAGAFLFALALFRPVDRRTPRSQEVVLGAALIVVSMLMFWIKTTFFPGFSAFAFNYSGNHWDHLTPENLQRRLLTFATNPQVLTTIVPALLLATLSWRYLLFPVLMAPLILAQLIAARIHLWEFHYYYAIPFLVIWAGTVVVAAYRSRQAAMRVVESVVLLISAALGSAPLLFAISPINSFAVLGVPFVWPVDDIPSLSREAAALTAGETNFCVSTSWAALAPDSYRPTQVLDPDFDLDRCGTVFVYYADPYYRNLSWWLRYWHKGPRIAGHFERYDRAG